MTGHQVQQSKHFGIYARLEETTRGAMNVVFNAQQTPLIASELPQLWQETIKMTRLTLVVRIAVAASLAVAVIARFSSADDWPALGRDGSRNSVSAEKDPPTLWRPERRDRNGKSISESQGIRWTVKLGVNSYSSPVVSGGLVWIGLSDLRKRDDKEDYVPLLQCFRAADGKRLYEFVSPQIGNGRQDAGWSGLGSSPLIEGDRLWIMTNRAEVLCWDIGPLQRGEGEPCELWRLDCIEQFDIHQRVARMGPPRPCSIGPSWRGRIFVTLNNGVSDDYKTVVKPEAPSLICLNKETGEVLWKDNSPGENILFSQTASPTIAEIAAQAQVIVPQSDGWLRGFDPGTGEKLWEFDVNPKESIYEPGGRGDRNDLFANAVVHDDRIYIASGREIEQGEGTGRLVCIDPTKRGDISSELAVDAEGKPLPRRRWQVVDTKAGEKAVPNPNSALVWEFIKSGEEFEDQMHRMLSAVSIAKGLVIAADIAGLVHCFDARTGKRHWHYDMLATVYASPLIVEDKVFIADEDGDVCVFHLGVKPSCGEPIATITHDSSIAGSLTYAEGTLYIPTRHWLTAVDATAVRRHRANAGYWPQWRGARRDNKSMDTGLLPEWPAEGPPLAWQTDGLGDGIASLALADGQIYTTTSYGDSEFAVALDEATGKRRWGVRIGAAVQENPLMRWLSQRSPTVDGQRIYVFSNSGWLVCLDAATGDTHWRISYPHEFGTTRGIWGYCDRPLVDEDHLIVTPGGTKATVAALDKRSGEVVWSKLLETREAAGYAAPLVVETDSLKQYVVTLKKGLASFAAADGRLLWRYDKVSDSRANSYTPLVVADGLLCPNGYGAGIGRLKLIRQGNEVLAKESFFQKETLDPFEDSTVLLDDRLYAFGSGGILLSLDAKDGKRLASARGSGNGKAAATFADGRLYVRWSDGVLALVDTSAAEYQEKGRFTLPEPRKGIGATFPVVAGKRLMVRDNDRLYCFDIAKHEADYVPPMSVVSELEPPRNVGPKPGPNAVRAPNAIFVPTPSDVVDQMLAAAKVGKDDIVYDLGSGDGRILIQAATKFECRAVGIEIDRDLVDLSNKRVAEAKLQKWVTIKQADLYKADFSEATVVAVYLYPAILKQLVPQFEKLKPGTRIVSHQFEIPDYPPESQLEVESEETGAKHTIYVWTTPLKK